MSRMYFGPWAQKSHGQAPHWSLMYSCGSSQVSLAHHATLEYLHEAWDNFPEGVFNYSNVATVHHLQKNTHAILKQAGTFWSDCSQIIPVMALFLLSGFAKTLISTVPLPFWRTGQSEGEFSCNSETNKSKTTSCVMVTTHGAVF